MSTAPKPLHRRFQFSLKTLFILVAMLAAGLGWVKWKVERERNERAAAQKLLNQGAVLYLDGSTDPSDPSLPYRILGERWDDWIYNIIAVSFQPHGRRPDLVAEAEPPYDEICQQHIPSRQPPGGQQPPITNSDLAHLKCLKSLERLNLAGTQIDDAGLFHLKELGGLRYLWLSGTKVSDAGVADLQEALPNCKIIR